MFGVELQFINLRALIPHCSFAGTWGGCKGCVHLGRC